MKPLLLWQLQQNREKLKELEAELAKDGLERYRNRAKERYDRLQALKEQEQQHADLHAAAERELANTEATARALHEKLYGGGHSKDLMSVQKELDQAKAKQSQLEDQVLSGMDRQASLEQEITRADEDYKEAQEDLRQAAEEDEPERQAALNGRKTALQATDAQIRAQLEPATLQDFDRLAESKPPAVAKSKGGLCLSCRMSLNDATQRKVVGGEIVNCQECGRFLILESRI